jgi:HK97 family phage portal protein
MKATTKGDKRTTPKREKRATFKDTGGWLYNLLTGGGATAAGISVNNDSALRCSIVYACVSAIASDVAKLPFCVFKRLKGGGKERVTKHPVYRLIHDQPNPLMTAMDWRRAGTAHTLSWGNGFSLIERNGNGEVIGLWPLRPDRLKVYRVDERTLGYVYQWQPSEGAAFVEIPYKQEDILHIPGLGFDGILGYDVISYARQSIGAVLGAERFGATFWGNGARPGGVLEHPQKLSDEAGKRLRESWNAMHGGPDNQNKVAILEEGMKYNPFTIAPENGQFIETRQFSVSEICRWFRMPPRKVGDTTRAQGWSTLEASNTEYVQDTLLPWLKTWEQRVNMRLFREDERDTLFAEHVVEGLLRADTASRATFYNSAITTGWMTRNEAREMENLPPLEGLDEPLTPVSQAQQQEKPDAKPAKEDKAKEDVEPEARCGIDASFRPIWTKAATDWIKRQANAVRRAALKTGFSEWAEAFFDEDTAKFRAAMTPAIDGYATALWGGHSPDVAPRRIMERAGTFASDMAKRHCESAKKDAIRAFEDGNGALDILLESWTVEGPAYLASVELGNERRSIMAAIEGI